MKYYVLMTVFLFSSLTLARGGGQHGGNHFSGSRSNYHYRSSSKPTHSYRTSRAATGVQRDSHGRIKRSTSAKNAFKKSHPCPSTGKSGGACPGYVIDHIRPLKRGGADAPSNMQWQTTQEAGAKDKWEQDRQSSPQSSCFAINQKII